MNHANNYNYGYRRSYWSYKATTYCLDAVVFCLDKIHQTEDILQTSISSFVNVRSEIYRNYALVKNRINLLFGISQSKTMSDNAIGSHSNVNMHTTLLSPNSLSYLILQKNSRYKNTDFDLMY